MINPQIKRMHEGAKKGVSAALPKGIGHDKTEGGEGSGAPRGHVEIHSHGDGTYHTIHHPSGERKDHANIQEAHKAVDEHFGEQPQGGDMESAAMGQSSEY